MYEFDRPKIRQTKIAVMNIHFFLLIRNSIESWLKIILVIHVNSRKFIPSSHMFFLICVNLPEKSKYLSKNFKILLCYKANLMATICQTQSPNLFLKFCYCFACKMRKKLGECV